eukprot:gene15505-21592_t
MEPSDVGSAPPEQKAPAGLPKLPVRPPKKVKPVVPGPSAAAAQPESSTTSSAEASISSGTPSQSEKAAPKPGKSSFMPSLPPRQPMPASGPVLDPDEPPEVQRVRKVIHSIRVSLFRAAHRIGFEHDNGLVKQVLYRLNLAEKIRLNAPTNKRAAAVASREAAQLEQELGPAAPLDFSIKMMLIGLTGQGKTQLVQSLLDSKQQVAVDPFDGTKHVVVTKGTAHGIPLICIDTPGLVPSASESKYNSKVLRQIRSAYQKHKPDLVIFVDRLDASVRSPADLLCLQGISEYLGPEVWLNTIVAFTHAGSPPPCGAKGTPIPFDVYANQKSHFVQQVIRSASGDSRLMNPTTFVESHPNCERDANGQPVLANGMGWRQHMYLLIISAKLLAATDSMLQIQDEASVPLPGSKRHRRMMMQQMMGEGRRTVPLPYLTSSATQFSRPMKYPDHGMIMETRSLISVNEASVLKPGRKRKGKTLRAPLDAKSARDLQHQIAQRLMRMRQFATQKDKVKDSANATLAGSKLTFGTPPVATRRPASNQPPNNYKFKVLEVGDGWMVRPHIEPHGSDSTDCIGGVAIESMSLDNADCIEGVAVDPMGLDNTDCIEGVAIESMGVYHKRADRCRKLGEHTHSIKRNQSAKFPKDPDAGSRKSHSAPSRKKLLFGVPYHNSFNGQFWKDRKAFKGRSEATIYHLYFKDNLTTSLPVHDQASPQSAMGRSEATIYHLYFKDNLTTSLPVHDQASAQSAMGRSEATIYHFHLKDNLTTSLPVLDQTSSQDAMGRSEATIYHDMKGNLTTSLSADAQASAQSGMPMGDMLVNVRADLRRKNTLFGGNKMTMGMLLTRLAVDGVFWRGPVAMGMRLQDSVTGELGKLGIRMDASAAYLSTVPFLSGQNDVELEGSYGMNLESMMELQEVLGTKYSFPITINANKVSYKGNAMHGLAAALQCQPGAKDMLAVRMQANNRNSVGFNVKWMSNGSYTWGLVAMMLPLTTLLLEKLGIIKPE